MYVICMYVCTITCLYVLLMYTPDIYSFQWLHLRSLLQKEQRPYLDPYSCYYKQTSQDWLLLQDYHEL